jgi:hypothetical protein
MAITKRQIQIALIAIAAIGLVLFISSKVIAASGLDDDVKLLLHGGVVDASTPPFFSDSSFSGHVVTAVGNADRATDKFSQSGFFDGSGDYLTTNTSSDFTFGTGDFTLDLWVRPTNTSSAYRALIADLLYPTSGGWVIYQNGTSLEVWKGGSNLLTVSGVFTAGTWHHVAWSRSGSSNKVFINGTQVGTTFTDSTNYTNDRVQVARVFSGSALYFNGAIDEVRVSKGIARWTSNFTVPTSPHTSDANTSLLLHMDGTSGSTTFTDSSGSPKTVTANGNAKNYSFSKFGGDGIYFDGSGDYLTIPANADFNFSTNNFTIDYWVNFNGTARGYIFDIGANGATMAITPSSGLVEVYGPSSHVINTGSTPFAINTWYHIALVRNGNSWTVYRDGTSYVSATDSRSWGSSGSVLSICRYGGGGFNCNAVFDEFRISKGTARWTSNFTPPTEAYGLAGITLTGNVKFLRNIAVIGSLSKGAGTFVIDHPQKPRTHLLYHSFVESNEVKNLYDGIAELDENGEAVIRLPDYFEELNKDFRYQYFPIGEPMPNLHVKEKVKNNQFVLAGGKPSGRVSWQVTGVRHDPYIEANPLQVEVVKGPDELVDKGECMHQEACI